MKRVLVCGGRKFADAALVDRTLNVVLQHFGKFVLVHGDATGADTLADQWAKYYGCTVEPHPAKWRRADGSTDMGAGIRRNAEMLTTGIDLVVVFKGGTGTSDMFHRALRAGVDIWDLQKEGE